MTRQRISRGEATSGISFTVAMILAWSAAQAARAQEASPSTPPASPSTQTRDETGLEEIVVHGYRRSLEASLDIKRDAIGSVDAIVAEDIAKFPDLNLAESIQRIPGVSIARDAGEGRQVTVRGLGPQFTRVRVNGMEAMSANGGTDAAGGTNRDRSFDFNTFASELFSAITIRKTAAAEVEEGSLGATVDLRAARPFDYPGFTFATSVQGSYNDIQKDVDPRAALLISDRFFDGKVGALLSAAYSGRKLLDEGSSTVRWQNAQNSDGTLSTPAAFGALGAGYPTTAPSLATLNTAYRPRIPRFDEYKHDQDRLGLTSSVQWQATDSTLVSVDALYAKFKAERNEIFLEAPVFSTNGAAGIGGVTVRDAAVDENGTLVYGVFDGVDIRSEARHDELETQFTHVTLDLAQDLTDTVKLHGLVGYSEANHQNPIQTTVFFDRTNINGYSYDFRNDNRIPLISYGNADVTSTDGWQLTQIRLRPQTSLNTFKTVAFEMAWQTTDQLTLKAGPQYKKFKFGTTSLARSNGTTANQEGVISASAKATPISSYSNTTSLSSLDLPAGTAGTWLTPDLGRAAELFDLYNRTLFPLGIETALANNYDIEEKKDTGGFLQADLETTFLSRRLRGNLGIRYVKTDQTSSGYSISTTGPLLSTAEKKYSDTLPSLNVSLDLTDSLILRLAAAKVMARPNGSGQAGIGILAPGASANVAGQQKTLTVGNPDLDPYRANAYDLAAEWYFGKGALLSVALFYKDVKSFVQVVRQGGDFSANPLGLPDSVALAACGTNVTPTSCLGGWQFNVPRNSPGGTVKGFEVNYQQPFTFLPAPFDNMGAVLNYTGVDSSIDYFVTAAGTQVISSDLAGLSKNAFNATLYYETDRFGVRVSAAYRDSYVTTVPGRNLIIPGPSSGTAVSDRFVEGTNETLNIDFSSSLHVNANLDLTFEALNLTDEYQDQFVDSQADRLSYYHHQGRQYLVGARLKF